MDILKEKEDYLIDELLITSKRKQLVKKKYLKFKGAAIAHYMEYEDIESFLNESVIKSIQAFKNYKLRLTGEDMNEEWPIIKEATRFDNFGMLMGYCERAFHYNVDKHYKKIKKHSVVTNYAI